MSVKSGYRHIWGYKGVWREYKIRPGVWRFVFKATKRKRSKNYGSFGRGSKVEWRFGRVKQRAQKTKRGTYETVLTGYKYFNKARVK